MANTRRGPLDGLRVVELTDESARFAGKLLAESGRLGRPHRAPGASVRRWPTRASPPAAACSTGGSRAASTWVDVDLGDRRRAGAPTGAWPSTPTW